MAYPVDVTPDLGATPSPAYSGVFIPEIWSGKLIEKFYASTVFGAIANTDYEGEIKAYGDKVQIRQRPTVQINDYEADGTLSVDRPSVDKVSLLINKGKYFNTILDDVMKIQADIQLMNEFSTDASEQMKIKIDTDVLDYMVGTPAAANKGLTAGAISASYDLGTVLDPVNVAATPTAVIDLIVDMGSVLDEANIPEEGRWLVLPAKVANLIKKSELRDASISGDGTSMLRNGRLGMIDRFTLYRSNLLPTNVATRGGGTGTVTLASGQFPVFAGISNAVTFASQMTNTETLRAESTFGSLVRGLQVYGREVVDPTAMCEAIVDFA